MPIEFDITPAVRQNSGIPFERLTVVRCFEDLPLAQIRRGVIYFFAGCSGLSLSYFRLITESLASLTDTPGLQVYVVDLDCVPPDFLRSTFGHLRSYAPGSGETAWVRDGRIVSVVDIYRDGVHAEVLHRTSELFHDNAT